MTFESKSARETEAFAGALARTLAGGEVIALHGEMGAGKTHFVRGMVVGLGGEARSVSSPTFVLLNVYDSGSLTVRHLDAYRVAGAEDFEAIGFGELLEQPKSVTVVEWPSRIASLLPATTIHIHIESTGLNGRLIRVNRPA